MFVFRRYKLILAAALVGVLGAWATLANRRPTLTDPAEISKLPGDQLRDGELEQLIRAAFLSASSVRIRSETAPSITVTDPNQLADLANEFGVGFDKAELPMYRHPGLEYTRLTFDGPYNPEFVFTGPKEALLLVGKPGHFRHFAVRTRFSLAVARLLGLKLAGP
ncbi:MAG TPA: hypothetical protein VFI31_11435 [Pirellulales bacterium]|nr:hypothetical protein [Pirellulales bacterium]